MARVLLRLFKPTQSGEKEDDGASAVAIAYQPGRDAIAPKDLD